MKMDSITKQPMMNVCFRQEIREEKTVHQFYIYDDVTEIGKFNWETWSREESKTSAVYFRDKLNEIPDGEEIELFINSNGGSVKEGTTIFNLLKRKASKITGIVDGVAHSIAFVILQACDNRIMGEGTSALIHEMWISCMGNAEELRLKAEQLDSWMESSRALFMSRAKNITEEELKELMKKETILTPQKALEYGFIDEIEGGTEKPKEKVQQNRNMLTMKAALQKQQDFEAAMKEFEILTNKEEQSETDILGAFFNAFL